MRRLSFDKDHLKKWTVTLAIILAVFILVLQLMGYIGKAHRANADSPKKGVIAATDPNGGILYSKPSATSTKLGTLSNYKKVKVLEIKNGWVEVRDQSLSGYIKADSVRFYSNFPQSEAKAIADHVIQVQRETWKQNYTRAQLDRILLPHFTQDYIDKYINQLFRPAGKDAKGIPSYHIVETEIYGYAIDAFDWKAKQDPEVPVVTHYTQDGKEILVISQYHLNEERGNHMSTLFLSRSGPNDNWKVYNYMTAF